MCNNLYTVAHSAIRKTLGRLSPRAMARIDACLKAALDLK